jgi:hypothetical protein
MPLIFAKIERIVASSYVWLVSTLAAAIPYVVSSSCALIRVSFATAIRSARCLTTQSSNASIDVKKTADYVTEKDNCNGGIAEIIEKFIL